MSVPVTIVGNLTADVELKFTPQGKAVAKFSVGTSERFKTPEGNWDSKNPTFWNIIVWDKQAEYVADSIGKGDEVIVFGKAYTTSWEDKKTGEKRSRMEVTATKVAVSLARAVAKVDRYPYQKVASKEDNPWSNGVTVTGGGWATTPSDDIPPF
jgi:single-strand DNA-binding protein